MSQDDMARRQLAVMRFERLRQLMLPRARTFEYFTDEDVFRDVS